MKQKTTNTGSDQYIELDTSDKARRRRGQLALRAIKLAKNPALRRKVGVTGRNRVRPIEISEAQEFVGSDGKEAWGDIDSPADDAWAEAVRKAKG